MKFDIEDYTNRRGLCTTFIIFYILFVMVENLQCSITRNIRSVTDLYPWQASLYYKNESEVQNRICSAALISDNAVITAAHCIHNKPRLNLTVTLSKSSIHINVKRTKKFDYYHASHTNDIAILVLRKKEIPPGVQQPIKFDHEDLDIEYSDKAYFKSFRDDKTGTLQLEELMECWVPFPGEMICGRVKSSRFSKGDSGGIIWMDYNGEQLAIGITSHAVEDDCNSENCLFIFTKLKYYDITGNMT